MMDGLNYDDNYYKNKYLHTTLCIVNVKYSKNCNRENPVFSRSTRFWITQCTVYIIFAEMKIIVNLFPPSSAKKLKIVVSKTTTIQTIRKEIAKKENIPYNQQIVWWTYDGTRHYGYEMLSETVLLKLILIEIGIFEKCCRSLEAT